MPCPPAAVLAPLVLLLAVPLPAAAAAPPEDEAAEDGIVPLFDGRTLEGWRRVNCARGTFTVRDGMIVSTGVPTGVLRTERRYENFVLELEWSHREPRGNAGLFVWSDPLPARGAPFCRAIEVQILDGRNTANYTSHGDVFAIRGATLKPDRPHPDGWMRCLPSERRARPSPAWNRYRLTCRDGRVELAVNGEVVSGASACVPREGYICLESEGSECWFRDIRIRELPSTAPAPGERAARARGFRSLYTGLDLSGWRSSTGEALPEDGPWRARNWTLVHDGRKGPGDGHLWTERSFADFELICDWRFPAEPERRERPVILPSGDVARGDDGAPRRREVADAGDSGIYLRGSAKSQVNIWCWPVGSGEVWGYRTDASQPAAVRRACTPSERADRPPGEWNRFRITMRGERLTVVLNGTPVIEDARLPGVPRRGPIALQHHGAPIEFANIYVRELEPSASDDPDGDGRDDATGEAGAPR